MEVEVQLAYGDVLNNSGLSYHFTVRGVLQCPGREILLRAMKEVLLETAFLVS